MPSNEFAEMTLRAAAVVPPIRLFDELESLIPSWLPRLSVPVASMPM
jgi:hypothetical protein